ncbi:MAG: NHLP bacteriocin system secretion protein [Syntrophomonadaceae bacterium]|nr:NHLP bacteriocin system secretion protein [Syntrophomonadaceae bacterium]MDD3270602.1 NHLP bacteriocin system secretion protein [Syntrophomonadaceae bacterium]MDD3898894.1 NHLP bacteriocin system secretion protein [Syntrophomonadaceae bacterium]MDD4561782.1 NHLP bacteriocin system secretion protein [Syntrophomonadaceae bacterium]
MKNELFRKVSLDRLSSPEQLDQMIAVTTPKAWLALIGIAIILITAIIWSIFGTIPTNIDGQGILINSYGIQNIIHTRSGQVTDIRVAAGDYVKRGEVVVRIDQPQLVSTINDYQAQLAELEKLNREPVNRKSNTNTTKIAELKVKIAKAQDQLERDSSVISLVDGRVLEVQVKKGDLISPGMSLMSVEREGKTVNLGIIMYVKAEEGKNIFPGMEVQISPSTVQKEVHGLMLGRVVRVSEFPSTTQGMLSTMGSKELVSKLEQGASLEVRIDIVPDASTLSGYKWSSGQGPPFKIGSGTFCTASITINKQKPIGMIIPMAKKTLAF